MKLTGLVLNDSAGVMMEAQGTAVELDQFISRVQNEKPPLARIDSVEAAEVAVVAGEKSFAILNSLSGATATTEIAVDSAVCPDCLREMFDGNDRRFNYGLTNCTNCGPRFTIIKKAPYDRPNTTMADFPLCGNCSHEYEEAKDRRFHAQPVSCPKCGPQIQFITASGEPIEGNVYVKAAEYLKAGKILLIKGIGGYHLACDAQNAAAVQSLRKRKNRDTKPFALMVRDLETAKKWVKLSEQALAILTSPAAPIVIARKQDSVVLVPGVADGMHRLGVMLAYTPIQHLIFAADNTLGPLVMTSANVSDDPLVYDDQEAFFRIGGQGMCDAILRHNRPIQRPIDDSVAMDLGNDFDPLPIRRARGYVPVPITLPFDGGMGLAVGAELKDTVAVVRGGKAILSHHLGDLTHAASYSNFRKAMDDMQELFGVKPTWVARDRHPVYMSTSAASDLAAELGVPEIPVQHHHAHAAAVLAEHGFTGKALAIVCDGVGYGADGNVWGGELLEADLEEFTRLGHLKPLALIGGDAAATDGRRCGLAILKEAFGDGFESHPLAKQLVTDEEEREFFLGMLKQEVRCVTSTSAGRLFDGISALLGVCLKNTHEAESAMKLEAMAAGGMWVEGEEEYWSITQAEPAVLDWSGIVRELAKRIDRKEKVCDMAAFFHRQFAGAWAALAMSMALTRGLDTVAISGGTFCNEILTFEVCRRLRGSGLRVLRHKMVPPNDGGIALGQAAVASAKMRQKSKLRSTAVDRFGFGV